MVYEVQIQLGEDVQTAHVEADKMVLEESGSVVFLTPNKGGQEVVVAVFSPAIFLMAMLLDSETSSEYVAVAFDDPECPESEESEIEDEVDLLQE